MVGQVGQTTVEEPFRNCAQELQLPGICAKQLQVVAPQAGRTRGGLPRGSAESLPEAIGIQLDRVVRLKGVGGRKGLRMRRHQLPEAVLDVLRPRGHPGRGKSRCRFANLA